MLVSLLISSLSGSTINTSDWLGKPRIPTLLAVLPDKLDIKGHQLVFIDPLSLAGGTFKNGWKILIATRID